MTKQKIDGKTLTKVVNNTTGGTSFRVDGVLYMFKLPLSYKMIPLEVLSMLYSESPNYIENGYIYLEKKAYDYLNISNDVCDKIIPLDKVKDILEKSSADELGAILEDAPSAIRENIATVAQSINIDSNKKRNTIKKKTGYDISSSDEE